MSLLAIATRCAVVAALCAGGVSAAGCGSTPSTSGTSGATAPDGAVKTGPAAVRAAGRYTLEVLDSESYSPRTELMDRINERFERAHPNITVKRVTKAFQDYMSSVKLTLSGDNPACVAMGDQGRDVDGQLVRAGLLRPLDDYARAYDWPVDRTAQWSDGGDVWGEGETYSVSPFYNVIALYYNKAILRRLGLAPPTTFDEFVRSLEKAKRAGMTPIALGNADRTAAAMQYEAIQGQFVPKEQLTDFVFRSGDDPTFDHPGNLDAATLLRDWTKRGYFTEGYSGLTPQDAVTRFIKGRGLYHLTGPWYAGMIADGLGEDAGLMLLPPRNPGASSVATGGLGGPWHITSGCDEPDVAAAYLDFLIGPEVARMVADAGELPSRPEPAPAGASPILRQLFAARDELQADDGIVPFIEVAYPGFADSFYGALQELMEGRVEPAAFVERIEQGYTDHFEAAG